MSSDALHVRVRDTLAASVAAGLTPWSDARFDALAQALFQHQFDGCAPYRHFCKVKGVRPESLERWQDIPAVPTDVFRKLDLCTFPPGQAEVCFLTSGTTTDDRGRHFLGTTATYEASLGPWLDAHLLPAGDRPRILVLAPSAAQDPHSSLSFMLQWAVDRRGGVGSGFCWTEDGPDLAGVAQRLSGSAGEGTPVLLLGTARALQALLEAAVHGELGESIALPVGSRVMETGGFKGAAATLDRDTFYAGLAKVLGIEPSAIVSEYGMTELGSQGYQPGLRMRRDEALSARLSALVARDSTLGDRWGSPRLFAFPPWCRVRAVDPDSLDLLPESEAGLLRFWDLSNVDSILAIQTADVGRVLPEGVMLEGRALQASPRGCSLAVDELLAAQAAVSP